MKRAMAVAVVLGWSGLTLPAAEITVSAAASLKDALSNIVVEYGKVSKDKVRLNFAGSNTLARQIEAGAPVDIFFSADDATMDYLEKRGLVEAGTRRSLLSNSLVIVVPSGNAGGISRPGDLAGSAVKRLALADPKAVPAGLYARRFLEQQGLWKAVAGKVIPTANVRAAMAAVASGNVDAGIVYRTDAAVSEEVEVACAIPQDDGWAVRYPVAVLRVAREAEAARAFLGFLQSPDALQIFVRHGFLRPDEKADGV